MQIQADLHTHTVASTHAYSTVTEMAAAAAQTGVKLLGITDHGPGSPDAPHLWHFHNYKVLPRRLCGVHMLYGVEADIMDEYGNLDMDEHELSFCEWVVASYHTACVSFERTPEAVTQGYLRLCRNPLVDVIGHPTTAMFPCDYEAVVRQIRDSGKLVEINESSLRWKPAALENAYRFYAVCRDMQVPIVVNTDAHFSGLVGKTPLAEQVLREIGFPDALNYSLDADRLMAIAAEKRGIQFETD